MKYREYEIDWNSWQAMASVDGIMLLSCPETLEYLAKKLLAELEWKLPEWKMVVGVHREEVKTKFPDKKYRWLFATTNKLKLFPDDVPAVIALVGKLWDRRPPHIKIPIPARIIYAPQPGRE